LSKISRSSLGINNENPIMTYTGASGFKQNLENIILTCRNLDSYQNMANIVLVTSRDFTDFAIKNTRICLKPFLSRDGTYFVI